MNHLGWLAEELTIMEEGLDDPRYAPYAHRLKRALQKAFVEACKASREMRLHQEDALKKKSAPKINAAKSAATSRRTARAR